MNVIQFVHEGLGNSSYVVDLGDGTAVVLDPDRTVARYLDAVAARDLRVRAIVETHLHADFISGAHELIAATGAPLFLSREGNSKLPHHGLIAGEQVPLDGVALEAVASPGHTPEHLAYVLRAPDRAPMLFSGGSLIVGGAARTDLIAPDMTDTLSRAQYRTLKNAFSALPDETVLYPTHGGGSFCSTGSGDARTSTLGDERAHNPAMPVSDEDEFARWFPTTFPSTPAYYAHMRPINQAGARLRLDIPPVPALPPDVFQHSAYGAALVDVRPAPEYHDGHVPGAISIPFRDSFGVWLGWLVPWGSQLYFVLGDVPIDRVVDEALLVGYEDFGGYLDGGMAGWPASNRPVHRTPAVTAAEAQRSIAEGAIALDVREPDEYESGHIPGAIHIPLGQLPARVADIPSGRPVVTYCGMSERSASASSVLEAAGRQDVSSLRGGFGAWRKQVATARAQ